MKKYLLTLLSFYFVIAFIVGPVRAEETLSEEAQLQINAGLDTIDTQQWGSAETHFRKAIELVSEQYFLDNSYMSKSSMKEYYKKAGSVLPAYVFYNLALASDKYGDSPLATAFYYQAYLAYDPETNKRRTIEKRIRALEEEHLKYIYPLCDASEARLSMVGFHTSIQEGDYLAAYCIMALTATGEDEKAKEIENRHRKGWFVHFKNSCVDSAYLDVGYAWGYLLKGNEKKSKFYQDKVRKRGDKKCQNITRPSIADIMDEVISPEESTISSWREEMQDDEWVGGQMAEAIDWINKTNELKKFSTISFSSIVSETCHPFSSHNSDPLPSPVFKLKEYIKLKNYSSLAKADLSSNATDNRYGLEVAQHNACAAGKLARYWALYQRTKDLWEKRSGKMTSSSASQNINTKPGYND